MIETISQFESQILLFIQNHLRVDFLSKILAVFTTSANHGELWIDLILIFLIPKKTRKGAIYTLAALAFCSFFNDIVFKNIFHRIRPFNAFPEIVTIIKKPETFSFPSGHSCSAMAVGLTMLRKQEKKFGIPFFVLGLLMCYSRIYFGVHYPTDVLGGMSWGIASSFIVVAIGGIIERKIAERKQKKEEAE